MERILNIPSVISHSYFTFFGKNELLLEKEVNYFFSLLYLYRENLTVESTQQILKKDGNKKKISDDFKNVSVDIKLSQLQKLGIVGNYIYDDFKKFVIKLNNRRIVINTLKKDKRYDTQPMKMIEEYNFSEKHLHIKFTKEFLYLFLHTDEYFMKVDLNILFNIRGKKSKRLYLIIKDYINMDTQCRIIKKDDLEDIVGKIPSYNEESDYENNKDFFQIFDNINTVKEKKSSDTNISDVYVEYPTLNDNGLHKKYIFNFNNLMDDTNNEIIEEEIDDEYIKLKEGYDGLGIDIEGFTLQQITEIEKDIEKRFQTMKENGSIKPKNEDGYFIGMLRNEFIKLKPSESQKRLDTWIKECKEECNFHRDTKKIPFIGITNGNNNIFINDDYLLTNNLDFYSENTTETINEMNKRFQNGYEIDVIYLDGFPTKLSNVCLLSEDELKQRGLI